MSQKQDSDIRTTLESAADTASIWACKTVVDRFYEATTHWSKSAEQHGLRMTSKVLQFFGQMGRYMPYAYNATTQGVLPTTASIATGIVAQPIVEQPGKLLVDR